MPADGRWDLTWRLIGLIISNWLRQKMTERKTTIKFLKKEVRLRNQFSPWWDLWWIMWHLVMFFLQCFCCVLSVLYHHWPVIMFISFPKTSENLSKLERSSTIHTPYFFSRQYLPACRRLLHCNIINCPYVLKKNVSSSKSFLIPVFLSLFYTWYH